MLVSEKNTSRSLSTFVRGSYDSYKIISLAVWTFLLTLITMPTVNGQFSQPPDGSCACIGKVLTYTCTTVMGPATVWSGSAFDCTASGNRIDLLRSGGENSTGMCNDGAIVGYGVGTGGTNAPYTTRLNVTITDSEALNGTSVSCSVTADAEISLIGNASIVVIAGPYQQVPTVILTNANTNTLRFTWDSVDPNCPTISYESITSGCGTCSTTTDPATPTATCTGLQLGSMCRFSVRSAICGFTGMPSNTVAVAIRVPDPPRVSIIPVYTAADMNILNRLLVTVNQQSAQNVTDPLFGAITEYSTSYSGGMQRNTSCMDDRCEYEVRGPFQDCATSSLSITSVTVSASNVFGLGESSVPQTFGCTNQFVQVSYTSSVIVCTFLNTMDTSVKSCTVMYGPCDQDVDQRHANGSSTVDRPNFIEIQLDPSINSLDCFMYVVRANNVTNTVIVVDTRSTRSGSTSQVIVIASIVVAIIGIFLVVAVIIIIIVMRRIKKALSRHEINARPYHVDTFHSDLSQERPHRHKMRW